ncbi:MAG: hypothetical protein RIS29_240 [Bacteroidota bacterium]|jgi:hypothetical protein
MMPSKYRFGILIAIIGSISFSQLHAQEEITFNNLNVQSKEIQATKTVSGIEWGVNPFRTLNWGYQGKESGSVETHLHYFHESRLAGTWTLMKSIGLINSYVKITESVLNADLSSTTESSEFVYRMDAEAKLEPRWYFDARARYRHNKSILNNTGWFLAAPLTMTTPLLYEPFSRGYNQRWTPEKLALYNNIYLGIGYRWACSKHFLIETHVQHLFVQSLLYDGHFDAHLFTQSGILYAPSVAAEIKAAYTF